MIEMLANEAGEVILVIYAIVTAVVCFVVFWKIKTIWLFSFGMASLAVALVFWHIFVTERTTGLIVINRLLWLFILTIFILFAVDLMRMIKKNAGKS